MARRVHPTPRLDPDIARLAGVLADPSRIAMLDALLDRNAHPTGSLPPPAPARIAMLDAPRAGNPPPTGPLARHAGVTAATASGHLRRLVDEQLVLATH